MLAPSTPTVLSRGRRAAGGAGRAAGMRRRAPGWFSSRYSNQSSSDLKPIRTPAGRPCRVIRISWSAASFRYLDRSSFTLASATRRGWDSLLCKPRCRLILRDDSEDFDCLFRDVIEHPDLINPEAILRPIQAVEPLDATLADPFRLVPPVPFGGVPTPCADVPTAGP